MSSASAAGLRFAMVTTFYPPFHFGGDAVAVQRLSRALAARGHAVDVIHDEDAFRALSAEAEPSPGPEPAGVRRIGLRSFAPALASVMTHQLGHPVLRAKRLRRLLEDGGYDVIHYHNVSLVGGPAVLRWGQALKLYTAHEYWLVCPTHVLWRDGREPCTEKRCTRCSLVQRRPPQVWRRTGLLEAASRHVDLFCTGSRFAADMHAERGFEHPFEVLPHFVADDGAVAGAEESSPWPRPYFLYVGRIEHFKGLADVLPHFGADAPADLLVIGAGSEEDRLRRKASAEGLERVHFLGPRPAGELPHFYRHALATVFPSIGYETFGIVTIESLREGTPVIARNRGPAPELIAEGAGLLFDDAAGLGEAVGRIALDPALRARLGAGARRRFLDRYCESVVMQQYLVLIARAARERGREDLAARLEEGCR